MQIGGLENTWLVDSGCSRHMTRSSKWFSNLNPVQCKEYITFGDNSKGDQEIGESIFVEDDAEDADWGDPEPTPLAAPLASSTTTSADGPDPSSSTTWGLFEQPPQPTPAVPEEAPTAVEGEATSSREAPRHIQRCHPPQTMIGEIDQ